MADSVRSHLQASELLREAIGFTLEHFGTRAPKGIATAETRAVIARAYYSADRGRLAHFSSVLTSGVPADESDYGILTLRDFLLGTAGDGKGKAVKRIRYAKTEWALDAFLDGKVPKRLLGSNVELFPLPEETKLGDPALTNAAVDQVS
jgi:hypothetical protein